HPDRREEDLREGPRVDHLTGGIDALQRRERRAAIAKLAVVVVLEDRRLVAVGELEKLAAAPLRECDAGRALGRRRHVDELCRTDGEEPRQLLCPKPLVIDADADQIGGGCPEGERRTEVARLFEDDRVAWV